MDEEEKADDNNISQNTKILLEKIRNIIINEKICISEKEIKQLVTLFKKEVKSIHNEDSTNTLDSLDQKFPRNIKNITKRLDDNSKKCILEIIRNEKNNNQTQKKEEINRTGSNVGHSSNQITSKTNDKKSKLLIKPITTLPQNSSTEQQNVKSHSLTNITSRMILDKTNNNRKIHSHNLSCIALRNDIKNNKSKLNQYNNINNCVINRVNRIKINLRTANTGSPRRSYTADEITLKQQEQHLGDASPNVEKNLKPQQQNQRNGSIFKMNFQQEKDTNEDVIEDPNNFNKEKTGNTENKGATRRKWTTDHKPVVIRTNDFNCSYFSVAEKGNIANNNLERLLEIYDKITDTMLEKFKIHQRDVKTISDMLKQKNRNRVHVKRLEKFNFITPDVPKWALRGIVEHNKNHATYLLDDIVNYTCEMKGNMTSKDIDEFCKILETKSVNVISKNHTNNSNAQLTTLKYQHSEINFGPQQHFKTKLTRQNTHIVIRNIFSKTKEQLEKIQITTTQNNSISNASYHKEKKNVFDSAIKTSFKSFKYIKELRDELVHDTIQGHKMKLKIQPRNHPQNQNFKIVKEKNIEDITNRLEKRSKTEITYMKQETVNDGNSNKKVNKITSTAEKLPLGKKVQKQEDNSIEILKIKLNNINNPINPCNKQNLTVPKKNNELKKYKQNSNPLAAVRGTTFICSPRSRRSNKNLMSNTDQSRTSYSYLCHRSLQNKTENHKLKTRERFLLKQNPKTQAEQKQNKTLRNTKYKAQAHVENRSNDLSTQQNKIQSILLEPSKTYSVFKPILKDPKPNTTPTENTNSKLAQTENTKETDKKCTTNQNQRPQISRIPVRTFTRDATYTET